MCRSVRVICNFYGTANKRITTVRKVLAQRVPITKVVERKRGLLNAFVGLKLNLKVFFSYFFCNFFDWFKNHWKMEKAFWIIYAYIHRFAYFMSDSRRQRFAACFCPCGLLIYVRPPVCLSKCAAVSLSARAETGRGHTRCENSWQPAQKFQLQLVVYKLQYEASPDYA